MLIDRVEKLENEIENLKLFISLLPNWFPLHSLAKQFNIKSPQTILKRIENHNFEPDVDYKKIGEVWHINIKALSRLKMLYS